MSDCVGCGFCCKTAPCSLSMRLYNKKECPMLRHDGKKYRCGIIEELAIGAGCSSSLCNEDREIQVIENRFVIPTAPILTSFLAAFSRQIYSSDMLFLMLNGMKRDLMKKGYKEDDAIQVVEHIRVCMGFTKTGLAKSMMG